MENIEISLFEIIKRILNRWYIIILCALIAGGAAYQYVKHHTYPTYTATATLYAVSNTDTSLLSKGINNIAQAQELVTTYTQFMITDRVLNKVIDSTKLDYTAANIRNMINTSTTKGSPFFELSVTCANQQDALSIINAIIEIAPQEIYDVLRIGYFEAIDIPTAPLTPYVPSPWKKVLIGFVAGGIIPFGILLACAVLDTKIRSKNNLFDIYGLNVLGTIPTIQTNKKINRRH